MPLQDILDELYGLSDNRNLFHRLLERSSPTPATAMTHEENAAFVKRIGAGFDKFLAATTQEEATAIFYPELTRAYEQGTRETVFQYQEILLGECILLYTCLSAGPCREALRNEIVRRIEGQECGSRAAREWISLMIAVLEKESESELSGRGCKSPQFPYHEKLHVLRERRASLTCAMFQNRPALVGEGFVEYAKSAEQQGDRAKAKQCFQSVTMDLDYVDKHSKMPHNLRWELMAVHYWFEQACQGLLRLDPNDAVATQKLRAVQALRRSHQYPDAPSMPQIGPMAQAYRGKTPSLARFLQELQQTGEEDMFALAHQNDYCHDMDFYRSAMGSYFSARPLLQGMGVTATYDAAHQEVFDALDYMKQQQMNP